VKNGSLFLMVILCVAAFALPASAGVLYENGPINGTTDAWTINFGFVVSDSFTLTSASSVNEVAFGAWLFPGDVLESVEVSFTSDEFGGTTYFDQVVNLTQSNCAGNQYGFNVCLASGDFAGVDLAAGTYWMNLQNAVVDTGDPVYWDENSGVGCHSQGCPSLPSQNSLGTIAAEAFSVLGSSGGGTVPEPGSLLLFGSGVVTSLGMLRRKSR
jgi:PEP-CTERM motif-containing protein